MASLVKKIVKGHAYYYLVESGRVNGKPRIVRQQYLGTLENISAAVAAKNGALPESKFSLVLPANLNYSMIDGKGLEYFMKNYVISAAIL
jgi:hypothetical protein